MDPKCPNCGRDIDLVGPSDLKADYGIGPNALQHAREMKQLPEPWLALNNRTLWLRSDIEEYVAVRGRAKVESTVKSLMDALTGLPEEDRKAAFDLIREQTAPAK